MEFCSGEFHLDLSTHLSSFAAIHLHTCVPESTLGPVLPVRIPLFPLLVEMSSKESGNLFSNLVAVLIALCLICTFPFLKIALNRGWGLVHFLDLL